MRYFYIVVATICMLGAGVVVMAQEQKGDKTAGQNAAVESQEKEIVTDSNERRSDDKEYGENNAREMPQSQTHDENTGLPNVVASDKTGEL